MSLQVVNPYHFFIHCNDIETLISLSCVSVSYYRSANDEVTLKTLRDKHGSTSGYCFEDFVVDYDRDHYTKRSERYCDLQDLLSLAIKDNNLLEVSKLLHRGAQPHPYDLEKAAETGNTVMVEMLSELTGRIHQNDIAAGYVAGRHRELFNTLFSNRLPGFVIPWFQLWIFGEKDLIVRCLHASVNSFGYVLQSAAIFSTLELIEHVMMTATIRNSIINPVEYTESICNLIRNENLTEVEKMKLIATWIEKSNKDYNVMLMRSCYSGNLTFVDYFRSLGGKYTLKCLWTGKKEILTRILASGDLDLEPPTIASAAGECGDLEFFKLKVKDLTAKDYQEVFDHVSRSNYLLETAYLYDHFSDHLTISQETLDLVMDEKYYGMVRYLADKIPLTILGSQLCDIVRRPARWNHYSNIKVLIRMGARNFEECLKIASEIKHSKLICLFESLISGRPLDIVFQSERV
ncbi:Hypothetical protein POVR1_LOCUS539 [uncultured virus]|nr:Hypothetical protein POVR1_LOCUS539 [uncultured virus]